MTTDDDQQTEVTEAEAPATVGRHRLVGRRKKPPAWLLAAKQGYRPPRSRRTQEPPSSTDISQTS